MAEVMLGKELHPDRVIPVEKLYEILNEFEIPYKFFAQYGIENNAFAVVRCKDCRHWQPICEHIPRMGCQIFCGAYGHEYPTSADDFCSYGERRTDGS